MSDRSLTGYDNLDAVSGQPDEEVYLYDAETEQLTCASCNPTGARPVGVSSEHGAPLVGGHGYEDWGATWLSGFLPGWTAFEHVAGGVARVQPRYLSDSGRLFFDSDDALVPRDINDTWDVYEYEPEAVGGCSSTVSNRSRVFMPAHEYETEDVKGEEGAGCVGLISSGESGEESALPGRLGNGRGRVLHDDREAHPAGHRRRL